MLEGIKLSKIQGQKEIKFTDTTGKGTRLGLIVVRLLDSYQRGKKRHRREKAYYSKTITVFQRN